MLTPTKQHQDQHEEQFENIPVNYFCRFRIELDLYKNWKVRVNWKDGEENSERFHFITYSELNEIVQEYNNTFIRENMKEKISTSLYKNDELNSK